MCGGGYISVDEGEENYGYLNILLYLFHTFSFFHSSFVCFFFLLHFHTTHMFHPHWMYRQQRPQQERLLRACFTDTNTKKTKNLIRSIGTFRWIISPHFFLLFYGLVQFIRRYSFLNYSDFQTWTIHISSAFWFSSSVCLSFVSEHKFICFSISIHFSNFIFV